MTLSLCWILLYSVCKLVFHSLSIKLKNVSASTKIPTNKNHNRYASGLPNTILAV